jgi:hypothetical protein
MLAGHYGGSGLAAEEHVCGANFNFGTVSGKAGERNDGVGGVQADADEVDGEKGSHGGGANLNEKRRNAKLIG